MTPEAKIEATMQHEITRLTSENLVSIKSARAGVKLNFNTNYPTNND